MKKKLEAELMSIAHRILKMKNKSDLMQLHQEAQKLYEKLSVLRFVEENLADVKPTIGYAEVEDKLAEIFDKDTVEEVPAPIETVSTEAQDSASKAQENKGEAIKEIISGISEKANKHKAQPAAEIKSEETETEKAPEAEPDKTEIVAEEKEEPISSASEQAKQTAEPVAELQSPEENVAPAEAEATTEANEEEKPEDPSDSEQAEQTPETEPAKIEEPAEEKEPDPSLQGESAEQIIRGAAELSEAKAEVKQEDLFKPVFEWGFKAKKEEPKITPAQISFDDLLGQDYVDPVFVKPEEVETPVPAKEPTDYDRRAAELAESNRRLADLRGETVKSATETSESKQNVIPISRNFNDTSNVISINKTENLNDRISKGITIGLNDRIAFMKHLFNNSSEDYNRVLSQLITFDTLPEAQNFIDTMVKPDYNNWEGKEEYEQRFMEIVEKKFS